MSTGLKVLLDAAQYIEHQEKLKRSPTTDSNGSVEDSYISQCSTGFDIANGVRNNNNNVMNAKNTRSIADLVQVSTSAPAASTTFHHIKNGVIITNNNSSLTGSQLLVEMKPSQRKQNNNRNMSEYDGTIDSLKTSPKIINSSKLLSIQTNTTTDNAVNETCISANQPPLKNGELGKMILEDGTALQCIEGDESLTRHNSTGSHYLQMMSAQHSATSTPLMHLTPTISASGRRRTISSNSNGAGTREVHNKLEKNRRAHLKECYEQLKNQLPLKEDERKKTSNLAILGEAIKYVKTLKKKDQELEAEVEQLAKMKINSQLKLVSLKRELGPKYEQMFPGPFLDFDINNFEKDNSNETASLSSGRGSILYSSSSSLSSGGSNGSTTMSSPVGASMPQPSALSPVISKACINNNISSSVNGNNSSSNINVTAKSPAMFEHKQQIKSSASISDYTSPTGMSPTNTNVALANRSITNVSSAALSLTAKNISAMSLTRDSPTPSTPSPSPSSSSCISSSSSLISSSPPRPLNGIISGRSVTVSIPNNVKFASSGLGTSRVITPVTGSAIVNATSSTTATILSASSPSNGVNSTNNAIMLQALRGCHLV
uniref:Max-binding protein MNT n=1 Tax=Zeugodacus cucurbitae TaxID=28588 RepID=A0A0A1WNV3_ZEUCU